MQITLREEIDADLNETYSPIGDQRTDVNQYEIYCGTCNKVFYTDKDNSVRIARTIEQGLDNPFLCDDCMAEYEELAVEER